MSVISVGALLVMSALAKSRPGSILAQRPRVVVVAVDERHLRVQRLGAGGQFLLRGGNRLGHQQGEADKEQVPGHGRIVHLVIG